MTEVEIKQDIVELEELKNAYEVLFREGVKTEFAVKKVNSINNAIEALREYAELQDPKPLTEDQIRGRLDKSIPTWMENIDHQDEDLTFSGWAELTTSSLYADRFNAWWFGSEVESDPKWSNHGITWNAFDHPPKQPEASD